MYEVWSFDFFSLDRDEEMKMDIVSDNFFHVLQKKTILSRDKWVDLTLWIPTGGLFCPSGGRSYAIFLWTGIFLQTHDGFSNWSIWQLLEKSFLGILFKTFEIMAVKVEQSADSESIDPARSTLNIFSYSKILSFW